MKKDWMIKESELDDDQVQVLMATLEKSCVVSGCAGSGKSVLALIKAKRIQEAFGANYQIVVYTKSLCRYMNSGRQELGLVKEFTYHWEWEKRMGCPHSDYIIVDEIQDFSQNEVAAFIAAANKGFFFFGDTAQSIYEGLKTTLPVNEISNLPHAGKLLKTFELYRNYRLPLAVARLTHEIGVDLDVFVEGTYKSTETSIPRVVQYQNLDSQLDAIQRIVSEKNLTDVGILLPRNDMVKFVADALSSRGLNCEMKYDNKVDWHQAQNSLNFSSTNPKIMTYHSAKGLQFETVFLPSLESVVVWKPEDRKPLYVAMTRTYRDLYVMYSGSLPAVLENVDQSLYKTQEVDQIEDI